MLAYSMNTVVAAEDASVADRTSAVVMPADPHQISRSLRIRDADMRERISAGVVDALRTRRPSAVLQREEFAESVGQLIIIRPARETDQVVITIETLDPGCSGLTAGHVSDLFRLSPSEADIALALFHDENPAEIAQTRGVQLETVRGQIKTVLHKVGVTSQKQLLRVLSQVAAAIA